MNDKELLELAAKAARVEYIGEGYARKDIGGGHYENYPWNPLNDDADAFRLAVTLRMDIRQYDDAVVVWSDRGFIGTGRIPHGNDPCAATCRAIVIAAAQLEIFKTARKKE